VLQDTDDDLASPGTVRTATVQLQAIGPVFTPTKTSPGQ